MAETHLAEELAKIAFKQKRIPKAENAVMIDHMKTVNCKYALKESIPFLASQVKLKNYDKLHLQFQDALYPDDQEDAQMIIYYEANIKAYEPILEQETITYKDALKALPQHLQNEWQEVLREEWVDDEDQVFTTTIKSLKQWIQESIFSANEEIAKIRIKPYLKQQVTHMAYIPNDKLERLQKYEIALNREYERKLAMLMKMQDIRKNTPLLQQS